MRWQATLKVAIVGLVLGPGTALAHHASDSEFDKSKALKLVGVVSKVDWVNPHIYVYLDCKDASGNVMTWALEAAPPAFWRRARITPANFLGDGKQVTVIANPGRRDPSRRLGMFQRLTRADGTFIQMDAYVATPASATSR
jgi:hypothetical protein